MIINTETILQNIFLASIVLMALSFPKIIIIFAWSCYRNYFLKNALKLSKKKLVKKSINNLFPKNYIESQMSEENLLKHISKEVTNTILQLKMPIIEAISSIFLMIICIIYLEFDSTAILIVYSLFVLFIVAIILGAIYVYTYFLWAKPIMEKIQEKNQKKE